MKRVISVAAALIFEDGKFFATKRGDSPYEYVAHKYEFPGGKIEDGERGEDCVKRELREELDLEVFVNGLFSVERYEYPDFILRLYVYQCERLSDFKLKEHESYAWISPKELDVNTFAPADRSILEMIKRIYR